MPKRLRAVSLLTALIASAFLCAPLRFDLGPLLANLTGRRGVEVLLSAIEFRFGTIPPGLFIPGGGLRALFAAT